MKLKYLVTTILIVLMEICSMYASSISIMIMQNSGNQTKVMNTSKFFEESLLDYFYEKGCIVSNAPIFVIGKPSDNDKIKAKAINTAKEGCFDYFVLIEVRINTDTIKDPDGILLDNISMVKWNIYSLDAMTSYSNEIKENGTTLKDSNDRNGLKAYSKIIAENIYKELIKSQKD